MHLFMQHFTWLCHALRQDNPIDPAWPAWCMHPFTDMRF